MIKNQTKLNTKITLFWCLIFSSCFVFSQDKSTLDLAKKESESVKFQNLFFDALTQKSISSYKIAIDKLNQCNSMQPNQIAVLFELSKNFFFLKKYIPAENYAKEALALDGENLWLATHLVAIYKKSRNFNEAIKLQKEMVLKHPKRKAELVYLHLLNSDKISAIKVLDALEKDKTINQRLRHLKNRLTQKKQLKPVIKLSENYNLVNAFEKSKSFKDLKNLLEDLNAKNSLDLLKYSELGITLFPAQPIVYLMNGRALNKQKKYKKAVFTLKDGIDFIIDSPNLENKFYLELVKAYQKLGDAKNIEKYKVKIKK